MINRFNVDTKAENIKNMLSHIKFSFEVVEIKTLNMQRYATLVISVEEDKLNGLMNPDIWFEGMNVIPYFGKPKNTSEEVAVYVHKDMDNGKPD